MHAFIWRNWTVVPAQMLADCLQATPQEVEQVARSMGLPRQGRIDSTWLSPKGYITVLRRNWHLLPYEQLTPLLHMTPAELAWRLIDDDYLYIKLGSLKPQCPVLTYHRPSPTEEQQARQMAHWLRELKSYKTDEVPRYRFFDNIGQETPASPAAAIPSPTQTPPLNIAFSYCSEFGDPLLDSQLSSWPEHLLAQLSAQGINGLWIHTSLSSLLPPDSLFPGSDRSHERLHNLQQLVDRAGHYGIRIFLYANEPRATQQAYFQSPARHSLGGVKENDLQAFCTSDERTLNWLRQGYRSVFTHVKGLGGVFTITFSENLTSCASHGRHSQCPRCARRTVADILAEVNNTIAEGVKQGNEQAEVIVWDWAWSTPMAEAIIPRLDKRCRLMCVSEWSLPLNRGGIATSVGEYAISAVGPGPRALRHWAIARRCGLPVMAKIQVNTSWELGSVASIPAMQLFHTHARNLARQGMSGIMYCWSLGGYPSFNMSLFAQTLADTTLTLAQLAARHYGPKAAPWVTRAWEEFSKGMSQYPYHIGTVYKGPQHSAPANPFYLDSTAWRATMVGIPYDDLQLWRGPYPADIYIRQMELTAQGFRQGIPLLQRALRAAPRPQRALLESDLRQARAIQMIFQSVTQQATFTLHRNSLRTDAAHQKEHLAAMLDCVRKEQELVRRLMPILQQEPTIGYESSNQYFYLPQDLREKYVNLRYTEQQLLKRLRP